MKTRISIAIFSLFLIACGNSTQTPAPTDQPSPSAPVVESNKFILKSSTGKFVSVNSDSILAADQTEEAKATVFEKYDEKNERCSFEVPNGKHVCHDRNRKDYIIANRKDVGEWETFKIIHIDDDRVNIKTSTGKFISSDAGQGGILYGNRNEAQDWEVFVMIKK